MAARSKKLMEPKVYIGVPTAEFARPAVFYDYLEFLQVPSNTMRRAFHTNSAAHNRNLIIDDALAHDCTHILFIDDDMAFAPNSLMKLLAHDKHVVSGLYFNKAYPHPPVIFNLDDNFRLQRHLLQDGETGLIEVSACGFGFMLVNTNIFDFIKTPYVRHGELQEDKRNEDMSFCLRLGEEGISIFCDLSVVVGHIGMATFWPSYKEGKWYTAIDTGREEMITTRQRTSDILTPLTK